MIKRLTWLMCLFLALLPVTASGYDSLDAAMADIFPRYKTVGAVVAVAKDGELVYHYDYGFANRFGKEPVTPETYFKTASVTKIVTGIRVMQLVEQGLLELDKPIGDYFGFPIQNFYYPETPVTLRQLMSHTSSISQSGGYSRSRRLDQFLDADLKRASNWEEWAPGSKYKYSNFGVGLLGSLMELVSGEDINTCVSKGVFQPLDMDAAYHISLLENPDQAAYVYNEDGTLQKSRAAFLREDWDPEVDPNAHYMITIGSLWIRGDDLCRLGVALCEGGTVDGVQLLQPETVELMKSNQQGLGDVTVASPYGLCINRVDNLLADRMVYGHQGLSDGILCNLYFEPQSRLVFAMITNGCSTNMDDHIGKLSRRVFAEVWNVYGE